MLALEDREGAAEAELLLSNLSWYRGNRDEAYDHMARAEALAGRTGASPIRARVLGELTRYHMLGGRHEAAITVGKQALEMANALGLGGIQAMVLTYTGAARVHLGDSRGLADMERAIEIATEANSPEVVRSLCNFGVMLSQNGDLVRGHEILEEARRVAEKFGTADMLVWIDHQRQNRLVYTGNWDDALASVDEVIGGERHYSQRLAYGIRAFIRLARGDIAGGLEDSMRSLELAREVKDPQALVPALAGAAFACLEASELADAGLLATEALENEGLQNDTGPVGFFLFWVLDALDRDRELEEPLRRVKRRSRWHAATTALLAGELVDAADIYAEAGAAPSEVYTRLRAAEAGLPNAQLEQAIAFYRRARATAYLARAEALVEATA